MTVTQSDAPPQRSSRLVLAEPHGPNDLCAFFPDGPATDRGSRAESIQPVFDGAGVWQSRGSDGLLPFHPSNVPHAQEVVVWIDNLQFTDAPGSLLSSDKARDAVFSQIQRFELSRQSVGILYTDKGAMIRVFRRFMSVSAEEMDFHAVAGEDHVAVLLKSSDFLESQFTIES